MKRIIKRKLRWPVPLNLWLMCSFILLIPLYVITALSTIDFINIHGIQAERNPLVVILIERFDIIQGITIHKIISFCLMAAVLLLIYKRTFPFLALWAANIMLINLSLSFLNDFFRLRTEDPGRMLFFFQLFEKYPLNIIVFIGLGLLLTMLITTNKK